MAGGKKQRMSLLDNIAAAGAQPLAQSMMSTNRALRSARDAVDSHRVWELDPALIEDTRFKDRLDLSDVADLTASIEANGQVVPILVRRDSQDPDRYQLVYGRRRLEAIRRSEKVAKVRALIAHMDEASALRAQVSENTARRDLSYIERALFAQDLQASGFGTQSEIADVLNMTKSAVSMALSLAHAVGTDLARAIGPAHSIGRPRWEALAAALETSPLPRARLIDAALAARAQHASLSGDEGRDPSVQAFLAVSALVQQKRPAPKAAADQTLGLVLDGQAAGQVRRKANSLHLDVTAGDPDFLDWIALSAQDLLEELQQRWREHST